MPEFLQLSDEDPSEQHNPSEGSDTQLEEVEQPAFPEGPAPPRCPICEMPGHAQRECHLYPCLQCHGPRGGPLPVCPICDPTRSFYFDGICRVCKSQWATVGRLCTGCDQIDYTPSTPPAELNSHAGSNAPTEQSGRYARFDLNLPPPEEDMDVDENNSDEMDDSD